VLYKHLPGAKGRVLGSDRAAQDRVRVIRECSTGHYRVLTGPTMVRVGKGIPAGLGRADGW